MISGSLNVKRRASPSYDIIDSQWNGRDVAAAHITWWTSQALFRTASDEHAGAGNEAISRHLKGEVKCDI